jgi:hypothetical protein
MHNTDRLIHLRRLYVNADYAWLLPFQDGMQRFSYFTQTNH